MRALIAGKGSRMKNVTIKPVSSAWSEISKEVHIEQAEVELGLSFEGEGNIYITKAKAGAKLNIKLTIKADK